MRESVGSIMVMVKDDADVGIFMTNQRLAIIALSSVLMLSLFALPALGNKRQDPNRFDRYSGRDRADGDGNPNAAAKYRGNTGRVRQHLR